jgi:hypothetical protein
MKLIRIATLILCIATFKESLAQNGATLWGVKAGFTQSTIRGANVVDSISKGGTPSAAAGFHIGLSVNSMIARHFWLKHEILFNQKGANIKLYDASGAKYNSKFRLFYVDLYPISPTFQIKGFQVFAGPYISILTSSYIEKKDNNGRLYKDYTIFGTPKALVNTMQKIDAGVSAGVEYEMKSGLNLGVKYVAGFVPIMENTLRQDHQTQAFNRFVTVSLGFSFGRRKVPLK